MSNKTNLDFVLSFESGKQFKVYIEVKESTAYAYLAKDEQIVGDVWLFNRGNAPGKATWLEEVLPPYEVPDEYCYPFPLGMEASAEDFRVLFKSDSKPFRACVYFRGKQLATIWEGATPGKNRLMREDCPVANTMTNLKGWE